MRIGNYTGYVVAAQVWNVRTEHYKRKAGGGYETKLIIGDELTGVDQALLRNIGRAHRYFDLVRYGKTFGEIAEGVSRRRIQQVVELAFLAPDVTTRFGKASN